MNSFPSSKTKHKKIFFSIFHLNIASLSKHKEELETLLSMLDCSFDIIGLTETKMIKEKITSIFDVSLNEFKHYHSPTESKNGGALLYVANHLNSKSRNDLNEIMYKTKVLESVFLEIINPAKKYMIVVCIYKTSTNRG